MAKTITLIFLAFALILAATYGVFGEDIKSLLKDSSMSDEGSATVPVDDPIVDVPEGYAPDEGQGEQDEPVVIPIGGILPTDGWVAILSEEVVN